MSIIEQQEKVTLHPKPGFVVKTKILESKDLSRISTKVFINVCHSPEVPRPDTDFEPEVVFPLIIENKWEIPIIVSLEKTSKDKKGFPSLVYDCCINSKCFQWCQVSKDLRSILIEWCIESVELLYSLTLEREYSMPKMLSKGELSETEITKDELSGAGLKNRLEELQKNETLGLLQELESDNDESAELPDLMNISGRQAPKKTLIQEISDPTPETPKKGKSEVKELAYSVLFSKVYDPRFNLAVVVNFNHRIRPNDFEVTYSSQKSSVIITTHLQGYRFASGDSLEIPVSPDVQVASTRCFSTTNGLYIFL
ncbi:Protein interacting with Hsp90 1 [Candida viswanathii]|uniref:Protein interacting with Hsp90 1 n=1 Tax=Candida viswanathii TaxID=5486 RepID=A0A367YJZ8_9ASCO|nr:Protein interacting with Hsp90 1 [Candida viswanathii]